MGYFLSFKINMIDMINEKEMQMFSVYYPCHFLLSFPWFWL